MSFLNTAINKLPFELHLPGYSYCGPGTKLSERLARGDKGINQLDEACKEHDIAYSRSTNINDRHSADMRLADKAWQRVKSKDSSLKEKLASWGVTNAMKAKVKLGLGLKSKRLSFNTFLKKVKQAVQLRKPPNVGRAITIGLKSAKLLRRKRNVSIPKVVPIPTKTGGALPLIPIFAGLSALGAISGGAAGIATAVNKVRAAEETLKEAKRHNRAMESIVMGKGVYLAPYKKKGYGLYLKPDFIRSKNL